MASPTSKGLDQCTNIIDGVNFEWADEFVVSPSDELDLELLDDLHVIV